MLVHEQRRAVDLPGLLKAVGLNLIWVNLSEVFRYFAFVMPMTREALPMVPDVAPMNLPVFLIWGLWDTLIVLAITLSSWLVFERFGYAKGTAVLTGTAVWVSIFVVLWVALLNLNLTTITIALVALPLAWIEMVIAALIALWCLERRQRFI
jgi:hypothetical protein